MLLGNFFYDCVVCIAIEIVFKQQNDVLLFMEFFFLYFRHGQVWDDMMQFSPAAQNDYTAPIYKDKNIA